MVLTDIVKSTSILLVYTSEPMSFYVDELVIVAIFSVLVPNCLAVEMDISLTSHMSGS